MRSILALLLLLPLALTAADRSLKVDRARSYVDVDVKATVDSFTARLEAYDLHATVDERGRVKTAALTFRFADLKTGKPLWDFNAGKSITSSPAVAQGVVVFGDNGGTLYCLEPEKP